MSSNQNDQISGQTKDVLDENYLGVIGRGCAKSCPTPNDASKC